MREVVEQVLHALSEKLEAPEERTALGKLRYIAHAEDRILLETAPGLVAFVRERLSSVIADAVSRALRRPAQVLVRAAKSPQQELFPLYSAGVGDSQNEAAAVLTQAEEQYTFRDFVVGAGNQFTHAVAQVVAASPGRQYNPLLIYGGVGLGKTHLLRAIATEVRQRHPELQVRYITADAFMAELVVAIRGNDLLRFKARFQRTDVLLLDDVQLLAGRDRTQEEFFHTFNALYEQGKQLVLSSDKPPKELAGIEERLRNRFEWGLTADIQPPDLETRIAILEKKAELEGVHLPYEVAVWIAENATHNVRELNGCFTRVLALACLQRRDIDLALAQAALSTGTSPSMRLTVERVQELVAQFFGLRASELRSRQRTRAVTVPRQIAMYLCRIHLGASFPYIGERFGGRDHTTVIHAVETVKRRQAADARLRATLDTLRRAMETGETSLPVQWKSHAW